MTNPVYDLSDYTDASYATILVEENGASYETATDWNLILTEVHINDPQARKFSVTVPGRDGILDLSESLGGVYYENRTIEMHFVCLNYTTERFHLLASTIRNAIEGRMCRISFSDDLGYFWRGRPQVDVSWLEVEGTELIIKAEVEPYKYSATSSYEAWKWDSFSFVDGVITQQSDITLDGSTETVTLPRDPARGKPTLWLNSGTVRARLSSESTWHTLKAGANVFPEIRMSADAGVSLLLNGTGSVGVEYRVGSL